MNLNDVYIRSVIDGKKSEKFILKDISFNFNKGEWVNIIGESGAGKTTLLELINADLDLQTMDHIFLWIKR